MQHTVQLELAWETGHLVVEVDRANLLHNSCEQLLWVSEENLHQALRIKFANEPGVDAGGPVREWLTLLTKDAFDKSRGLFLPTGNGNALTINRPLKPESTTSWCVIIIWDWVWPCLTLVLLLCVANGWNAEVYGSPWQGAPATVATSDQSPATRHSTPNVSLRFSVCHDRRPACSVAY